jgi:hypothetical protein
MAEDVPPARAFADVRRVAERAAAGRYPRAVHRRPSDVATRSLAAARELGGGRNVYEIVIPHPQEPFRRLVGQAASTSAHSSGLASALPEPAPPEAVPVAATALVRQRAAVPGCGGGAGSVAGSCAVALMVSTLGAAFVLLCSAGWSAPAREHCGRRGQ